MAALVAFLLWFGASVATSNMPPELVTLFDPPPPTRAPAFRLPTRTYVAGPVCNLSFRVVRMRGRLPSETIQRIMRLNAGRFRGCYEAALRRRPHLRGRVVIRFVIGRDGNVVRATAKIAHAPELGVCIADQMSRIRFPKPIDVVTVSYPLLLKRPMRKTFAF